MMKYVIVIILLVLMCSTVAVGQAYKCDSIYRSEEWKVEGGFKLGKKHGRWFYSNQPYLMDLYKVEEYWMGELVHVSNGELKRDPIFENTDTLIEYSLGTTVKHVLSNLLKPELDRRFYCEMKFETDSTVGLFFYHIGIGEEPSRINNFLALTNRFIVLEKMTIPVLTEYDRQFAGISWVISHPMCKIIIQGQYRIMEISRYY